MTDRPAYRWTEAVKVGKLVMNCLWPHCERVLICGSVRREKRYVHDVEIVFVPKLVEAPVTDFFNPPEPVPATEAAIERMLAEGLLVKRQNTAGAFTWGPLNKLAVHADSMMPVDLFCEPSLSDWGRTIAIRTGPKELNLRLIDGALKRGYRLHSYGAGFTNVVTGQVVACRDERQVFDFCGVEWIEPNERK